MYVNTCPCKPHTHTQLAAVLDDSSSGGELPVLVIRQHQSSESAFLFLKIFSGKHRTQQPML